MIFLGKEDIIMERNEKKTTAKALAAAAGKVLSATANSRCVLIFHQPKQPEAVRKFRKF